MIAIGFRRVYSPEEMEWEEECGLCGVTFRKGSVFADASEIDCSVVSICLSCLEYFGRRNPGKFPSLKELEESRRRYPKAMFASEAAYKRAIDDDATLYRVHEECYIA